MATKKKMLQAAAGNSGGGAGLDIYEVFSTYLYEGNGDGSAAQNVQTITNGIDLSGEGGMVWIKGRSHTTDHIINDTVRGANNALQPNLTDANQTGYYDISQFNSNGFGLDAGGNVNNNGYEYASWTFRKAPKFFDIVTYTGTGSVRTIAHNLETTVGSIWIKRLDSNNPWIIFHRSNGATGWLSFDTASFATNSEAFNNTMPTDSVFTLGTRDDVNNNGNTYVAYLFAHNDGDGEFGPDGDQDIIKCGSFTPDGSENATIDLGFEPQWFLVKSATGSGSWLLYDNMRGMTASGSADYYLLPNSSSAEGTGSYIAVTPTGIDWSGTGAGNTFIYMAIRRGPLAPPESATEVFAIDTLGGTSPNPPDFYSGWPVDMSMYRRRSQTANWLTADRLRGPTSELRTNSTEAEQAIADVRYDQMTGYFDDSNVVSDIVSWMWKRAPGFFDVVAYTGNYTDGRTVTHNLGVAPEMIWVKLRDTYSAEWMVFHKDLATNHNLQLDSTAASQDYSGRIRTPTATTFTVGNDTSVNRQSPLQYIAYLFASLDGISKVGSFSHTTGSATNVDCGFTAGARFVLIKRTDNTGHWLVFDTERGITAGNDAWLNLNLTGAEDSSYDFIDPLSSGFTVDGSGLLSTGTYIFYAIA